MAIVDYKRMIYLHDPSHTSFLGTGAFAGYSTVANELFNFGCRGFPEVGEGLDGLQTNPFLLVTEELKDRRICLDALRDKDGLLVLKVQTFHEVR